MQEPLEQLPDQEQLAKRLAEVVADSDSPEEALAKLSDAEIEFAASIGKDYEKRAAINRRLIEGLSKRGRLRRNAACPCGSGKKFKHCCLRDMKNKIHGNVDPSEEIVSEKEQPTDEN